MADLNLIKKYLSEDLIDQASKFDIPDDFLIDMPDLIEMILRSKSIDKDEEKQNWFNLLPLMKSEQIEKLSEILLKEKQKLKEIEEKYEAKKTEIKKKYLEKWQQMWYVKKVSEIQQKEWEEKSKEDEEAEELLAKI